MNSNPINVVWREARYKNPNTPTPHFKFLANFPNPLQKIEKSEFLHCNSSKNFDDLNSKKCIVIMFMCDEAELKTIIQDLFQAAQLRDSPRLAEKLFSGICKNGKHLNVANDTNYYAFNDRSNPEYHANIAILECTDDTTLLTGNGREEFPIELMYNKDLDMLDGLYGGFGFNSLKESIKDVLNMKLLSKTSLKELNVNVDKLVGEHRKIYKEILSLKQDISNTMTSIARDILDNVVNPKSINENIKVFTKKTEILSNKQTEKIKKQHEISMLLFNAFYTKNVDPSQANFLTNDQINDFKEMFYYKNDSANTTPDKFLFAQGPSVLSQNKFLSYGKSARKHPYKGYKSSDDSVFLDGMRSKMSKYKK